MLAEQYSDILAQDYRLRNVLLSSYHHNFSDLRQFDVRMVTCLNGMRLLKEEVASYLTNQLDEILSPGDLFSIALFAASINNEHLLSGCMGLAQAIPKLLPALLTAIDWMPKSSTLWPLLTAHPACRAYTSIKNNPFSLSAMFSQKEITALIEQNKYLKYLLCALHLSGSPFFIPTLDMILFSDRDDIKICACQAIIKIKGMPEKYIIIAREVFLQLSESTNHDVRIQAIRYLAIYFFDDVAPVINELRKQEDDIGLMIQAMGWSGQVRHIPSLLSYFEDPNYARLSTLAIISITGSLPEKDGWQGENEDTTLLKVDSESAEIPIDITEQRVCWPDASRFERWWHTKVSQFNTQLTYLGGLESTPKNLSAIINNGYLNLRPLAAIRSGQFPEFTALPADQQQVIFASLSEDKQEIINAENFKH
jgi:hypothetical protein